MKNSKSIRHETPVIFIAEDAPENLKVLVQFLRQEDYKISAVGNGQQALEKIPEVLPDLILLDIMLPGLDGYSVCQQLQKNPETRDIPIIFLSARADKLDIVKGFEMGAVDYITKPFSGAEVLARIKTHLELKFSRETLKELNATKDKLFSIIAHDLKAPLQSLLLSIDVLYGNYDSYEEEKKKDFIQRIHDSAHHLSDLLKNLLSWSRSQRGLFKYRPEKLNIAELVAENMQLYKENAQKKEINLLSEVAPYTVALADKNTIGAVLRNLISNAVKFTNPGGEVKVKAYVKDDRVEVTISDNGVGINPEGIDTLFQVDANKISKGTAGEKGTGLGLILCKEFIEKNNGTIEVMSTLGQGSSFKISLPASVLP